MYQTPLDLETRIRQNIRELQYNSRPARPVKHKKRPQRMIWTPYRRPEQEMEHLPGFPYTEDGLFRKIRAYTPVAEGRFAAWLAALRRALRPNREKQNLPGGVYHKPMRKAPGS